MGTTTTSTTTTTTKTTTSTTTIKPTTTPTTTLSTATPAPCDGCNCPMTIILDPSSKDTKTYTLKHKNYKNNEDCTWNFKVETGKLKLIFQKFDVERSDSCKSKDYVKVSKVKKWTKVWLCG